MLVKNGKSESQRMKDMKKVFCRHPEANDIIRQYYQETEKPDEKCECGQPAGYRFSEFLLRFVRVSCDTCRDIRAARMEAEKLKALEEKRKRFEDNYDAMVEDILIESNVPSMFHSVGIENSNDIKNYYITGGVGVGKTHRAVMFLKSYIHKQEPVDNGDDIKIVLPVKPAFVTVPELLLEIRCAFDGSASGTEKYIIDKYMKTPFLILDDLGVEKTTEWALQTLYIIINSRYADINKTTIITSNLGLNEIADKLNDRITSRINGMCEVVKLNGMDRRIKTTSQRG